MCFEEMEMFTGTDEKIVYTPLPFTAGSFHEHVISLHASGSIGYLRYLAVFDESFKIWKHDFKITKDTSLTIDLPTHSFLGLSFTLKSDLHCHVKGSEEGVSRENQFSLKYLPVINVAFQFKAGEECTIVGVDLTSDYLNSLLQDYRDVLTEFVMRVNDGLEAQLHPRPLYVSPAMILVIGDVLKHLEEGKMTRLYLQSKSLALIQMAIEQVKASQHVPRISLTLEEQQTIHEACEFLKKDLKHHSTLSFVASKYKISEQKLKDGFREMAGTDLRTYIIKYRMEIAYHMLTKQFLSVRKTAELTGYPSPSNFSAMFKKTYGVPPKVVSKLAKKEL